MISSSCTWTENPTPPSVSHSTVQHPSMEVTSFSTASPGFWSCSSSSELLLRRKVNIPLTFICSVSYSPNRRSVQSLFGGSGTRSQLAMESCLKVSCSQKGEITVVEGRSMDEIYDTLAERLLPTAAVASSPNSKHIVGLAGPPGAGKSTLASEVARRVNKLWPQRASSFDSQVRPLDVAAVLPMDGFHLYRHQLDAMEDPKEAHARRGAPWTFDPALLLTCLKRLQHEGSVYAPSFDHGVGDPVEGDILISLQHKVVIVEGNYLFMEEADWKEISSLFNEKWFIEVDIDTSMHRVVKRHISTGNPPDIAKQRIEYNDRPNAELIIKSKKNADLIIRNIHPCALYEIR